MDMAKAMRVQVLALSHSTALVPVGIADMLRKAADLAAMMQLPVRPVEVSLISTGKSRIVRGAGGIEVRCAATVHDALPGDLVIASALDPDVLATLEANRAAVPFLRRAFSRGADVASVCTGAFLLGEAGLLDGRSATTHWAFQPLFAARFPRVRLQPQAVIVDSGRVLTSGGATSFLNLALVLIERIYGIELARASSKMFLVDVNKSPQGAYAMFSTQKTHDDQSILRAQSLIEERLTPSVGELARATAMTTRTFVRRFRQATGNSPREYIQRVRVEAARRELESSTRSVSAIAERVGYGDVVAFRRLFIRVTGLTPADYRARYGPRSEPSWVAAKVARAR
jgi:transcriptional regulator GlxA family with amidase domain